MLAKRSCLWSCLQVTWAVAAVALRPTLLNVTEPAWVDRSSRAPVGEPQLEAPAGEPLPAALRSEFLPMPPLPATVGDPEPEVGDVLPSTSLGDLSISTTTAPSYFIKSSSMTPIGASQIGDVVLDEAIRVQDPRISAGTKNVSRIAVNSSLIKLELNVLENQSTHLMQLVKELQNDLDADDVEVNALDVSDVDDADVVAEKPVKTPRTVTMWLIVTIFILLVLLVYCWCYRDAILRATQTRKPDDTAYVIRFMEVTVKDCSVKHPCTVCVSLAKDCANVAKFQEPAAEITWKVEEDIDVIAATDSIWVQLLERPAVTSRVAAKGIVSAKVLMSGEPYDTEGPVPLYVRTVDLQPRGEATLKYSIIEFQYRYVTKDGLP